jgi:hypothetical protein
MSLMHHPSCGSTDVNQVLAFLLRRAEYAEMPGLCLTLSQAQRLWAADRQTCEAVFRALIAHGFLRMTTKGRFVRR